MLKLLRDTILADSISKDRCFENTYCFRREFFYRKGIDARDFACSIVHQLKSKLGYEGEILDYSETNKPFRGGASVKNSSHWTAIIKIKGEK